MSKALDEASAKVPADPRALAQLRRHIELGELEEVKAALPGTPRYLVTFMRSQTGVPVRSATSEIRVSAYPRSTMTSIAARSICPRRCSPASAEAGSLMPVF